MRYKHETSDVGQGFSNGMERVGNIGQLDKEVVETNGLR